MTLASISERVAGAASFVSGAARSLIPTQEEGKGTARVLVDGEATTPPNDHSPVRVNLRVRSIRLPRLYAPVDAEENHRVRRSRSMLEQLSNAPAPWEPRWVGRSKTLL